MRKLTMSDAEHVRAVAARLRLSASFCDHAQKMFDNPETMIAYALEDIRFAQQVLQPILESLELGVTK